MEFVKKVLCAAAPDASTALLEWFFAQIASDPGWMASWERGSERATIRSINATEHELLAALQRKLRSSA